MLIKHFFIAIMAILLLGQCKKQTPLLSLEESEQIMNCRANPIIDSLAIVENLIGNWKLIIYGCGECLSYAAPGAKIEIQENSGILTFKEDGEGEIVFDFGWYLEKIEDANNSVQYRFRSEPPHYALRMSVFCEKYISFNDTNRDGYAFLYKKQ